MSRAIRFLVLLALALTLSVHAVTAFAAPVGWESVDVTLESEQQSMLLVSGELPPEAKLPAEAELAVPAGTQLQWIGEILGGDPSKDPELNYTKSSSNGMDVYRFTLTKARVAQVEGTVPSVTSFDGTNYVTGLRWTAWQTVPQVRISQRIPQGSQVVQAAAGAAVQPGPTGYSFYTKTVTAPKAGDVIDLSFSYSPPAPGAVNNSAGVGSSSPSGSNAVSLLVIGVVAVGGLGLLFVNVNRKMSAKTASREPAPTKSRKVAEQSVHSASKSGKKRPGAEPAIDPSGSKRMKPVIPMLIVIGLLLGGFMIAGARGTMAVTTDGKISRNFGAASACQSASIPFTTNQGVDLAKQGEQLIRGYEGMEGVGEITVDLAQSKVDIAWCESSQSEESMRQVLSASGLITLGQGTSSASSTPTAAAVDASGKKQTLDVDTSSGTFSPAQIVLKANVPAEISFGSAAGCLSEVVIGDLGITQDLTKGPATVKLPALDAGTYSFACAMGHQSGQFVVQ